MEGVRVLSVASTNDLNDLMQVLFFSAFFFIVYVVGFVGNMSTRPSRDEVFEALAWPLFAIKWLIKVSIEMVVHIFKRLFLEW